MLANEKRSALVKGLPLDRLLTETDGPFTQIDNRPSRPSDVGRALDGLALLFGQDRGTVTAAVLDNLKVLLSDRE
jgi:TatD DNase family protein